jgi:hypothetical protein
MYTLTKVVSTQQLLLEQVPAMAGALVLAELFYKFGSFTLECLAFLATWYVIDMLIGLAVGRIRKK